MKTISLFLLLALQCQIFGFDFLSKSERISLLMEEFEPEILKAMDEYQVPGLSIGIVYKGELIYAKGFGWRDLENFLPASAETVYQIGSGTKAFTSFLAGTLIDQGLIQWDQRVIDMYPEFRLKQDYATLNLTLRDLLSHRSGLPRHDPMWYNSHTLTREGVMRRLRYLEPTSDIRDRYQYNNLMYLTAGVSMEHLMGKSWEELVTERILTPLGMNHTSFHIRDMQKERDHALPYLEKKGELKRMLFRDLSVICPAAGMTSNVIDLAKWLNLHLSGGMAGEKRLINPSTLKEMHTPQMIILGGPESSELILCSAGLGWNIVSYRGFRYVCHDGGVDGFTSMIGFFPSEEIGTIVLTNKNVSTLPRHLSSQIIDKLFDLPPIDWLKSGTDTMEKMRGADGDKGDVGRKKGTKPSHSLEEYQGEYFNPGYGTLSIQEKCGRLSFVFHDLEYILDHWHYDVFRIAEELEDTFRSFVGSKLSFQNGTNGEIETVSVPLEPTSKDIVFQKIVSEAEANRTYLQQFTGVYEAYSYVVEITVNKGSLYATLPGSPPYELIPEGENEFTAKSFSGYTVRFVWGKDGVEEAILIHPYGVLSAKKVLKSQL